MRTYPMATYEQDSEAYRWEVGTFHNYLFPNPPYFIGTTEQDSIFYSSRCIREGTLMHTMLLYKTMR